MASDNVKVQGSCFCGAVTFQVVGVPNWSAYCHCTVCQRLTGSPFIHTVHYPYSAFSWTLPSGVVAQDLLDEYRLGPGRGMRYRCKKCGICPCDFSPDAKEAIIRGPHLDRDKETEKIIHWDIVKPTAHIYYTSALVSVEDDLPKFEGYTNNSRRMN
ncbi:Mss4-like protein [Flagelloscypha sp. PMI_526]|nr:Mss4-like protein [Flagelloscypha sp. PMI_526]